MGEWNGHEPKLENYQLQFQNGDPVHLEDQPTNFTQRDKAIAVAQQLSQDWQVPIIVKKTV